MPWKQKTDCCFHGEGTGNSMRKTGKHAKKWDESQRPCRIGPSRELLAPFKKTKKQEKESERKGGGPCGNHANLYLRLPRCICRIRQQRTRGVLIKRRCIVFFEGLGAEEKQCVFSKENRLPKQLPRGLYRASNDRRLSAFGRLQNQLSTRSLNCPSGTAGGKVCFPLDFRNPFARRGFFLRRFVLHYKSM